MSLPLKILQALEHITPSTTAFVGLGNPDRGDDQFGLLLASFLQQLGFPLVFSESDHLDTVVLELRDSSIINTVIFLDALTANNPPGTVYFLPVDQLEETRSSHKVPIGIYGVLLKQSGKQVYCLGVEPAHLEFQKPLSPDVEKVMDALKKSLTNAQRIASSFRRKA